MNIQEAKREARAIVSDYIHARLLGSDGAQELMPNEDDNDRVVLALRELCWMIQNPTVSVNLMPDDYATANRRPYRVKRRS